VIFEEIDYLVGPAMRKRAELWNEILDQDGRIVGWFAQLMMLSPSEHPYTIMVLEMASQVAQMVAVHFKLHFHRGRPQQVFRGLMPMLVSPWHASYPSGHSLESHLIAQALGVIAPKACEPLSELAHRIATNREVAGVHYPSDTKAASLSRLRPIACWRNARPSARPSNGRKPSIRSIIRQS